MPTILVVDDDPEVLGTSWRALTREGHTVRLAESAAQALEYLENARPDLVILDIMMPHTDGLELCRLLRSRPEHADLPILFLSARGRTQDVVAGLNAGGDDYITKPFELAELNARIRALLRRVNRLSRNTQGLLSVGGLRLDPATFRASTENATALLTSTEYRLLEHLMSRAGRVCSIEELLAAVWEYPSGSGDPNLVRAHIRNLRQKLEADPAHPRYVRTVHGLGYFVPQS